jgi:hypothetical protein
MDIYTFLWERTLHVTVALNPKYSGAVDNLGAVLWDMRRTAKMTASPFDPNRSINRCYFMYRALVVRYIVEPRSDREMKRLKVVVAGDQA